VGLHFAHAVSYVMLFHKHDVAGLLFREILYAEDILGFFTQAEVQGGMLGSIVPIEVCN
jgi:hypothetical protein